MANRRIKHGPEVASQVERLAALGLTQTDAAYILGFDYKTLVRNYGAEWEKGKATAKAKISAKLFEKAMSGDSASIFFYLKTQCGWRETQHVDTTSSDGSMSPKPAVNIDLSNLTPQEIAKMAKAAFRGDAE